ncbi:MAG: winged helix DNA-binding protein [Thermoplasmatota archaeon]
MHGEADIYRTGQGIAAVTSDVQRMILRVLAEGTKQLPDLVEATGRSKPTLSSLHMKELLSRGLIEEEAHPTDQRRKVYRITASRVAPDDLQDPRHAPAVRVGLAAALDAIASAPAGTATSALREQAARLGGSAQAHLGSPSQRELWLRLPSLLEESGIAVPLRIDLQNGVIDLAPGADVRASPERLAVVLAGFVSGLHRSGPVRAQVTAEGVRLHLA